MSGQRHKRHRGDLAALGLLVAAGLVLGACSNSWLPGRGIYSFSEAKAPPTTDSYCYRTLAEVDCYAKPLPDAETRRMGWADVAGDSVDN